MSPSPALRERATRSTAVALAGWGLLRLRTGGLDDGPARRGRRGPRAPGGDRGCACGLHPGTEDATPTGKEVADAEDTDPEGPTGSAAACASSGG